MDIDIYQQCPCHADKKIKFCCGKDIVGDLNQILAKSASGQALAALDQLDRTIKKTGPKDCLLTIQTHILITQGEVEKAKHANELFLANNPGHPTGLHHRAMIYLAEGNVSQAVECLQDAMDAIVGDSIPLSLTNAFRMIGVGLLQNGHLVGGRAHLQFALSLKGGQDEELTRFVHETFRLQGTSILLKRDFFLVPLKEDVTWEKKYTNAIRAMDRGQFRKALRFLAKIDEEFPEQRYVVQGIAILHMFLGNMEKISGAWRRFGALAGISDLEAVEAEAIAQLFDESSESDKVDVLRVTLEVDDADKANEIALSSPRMVPLAAVGEDPFGEGPPPRGAFYLLDRDKLLSAEDLSLENVPEICGELMLFGKQTDRPARLEWIASQGDRFDTEQAFLQQLFAPVVQGELQQQKIAESSALAEKLSWNWHLPEGVTREKHALLVKQKRGEVLRNGWVNFVFSVLGNQTPRQAVEDPKYKIPLHALILNLEQSSDGQFHGDSTINEIREELRIDRLPKLDPTGLGQQRFSPLQQQYLQFEKLSNQQLLDVQAEAMSIGNLVVLRRTVPEVLSRPEIEEIPRDVSYSMMAQLTEDENQSLEYLAQARSEAKKTNRPIGLYLVQEFEFRLSRGLTEKLPKLLDTIKRNHLTDPDVEYQLVRVLRKYNLLEGSADEQPAAEEAPGNSPIWTPDSLEPVQSGVEPESEEPSKLWIPD